MASPAEETLADEPFSPRSFYNPYAGRGQRGGRGKLDSCWTGRGDFCPRGRAAHPSRRDRPAYTYVTDLDDFKFVAPACLHRDDADADADEERDASNRVVAGLTPCGGTRVGTLSRSPLAYRDGEAFEFLRYESSAGKLWPTRVLSWGGRWFGPPDFDPRFSRFHVYDMLETSETPASADGRDSARFVELVNPVGTVVTMFGMTDCGKRVAVHVYGVCPYFYMNKSAVDSACGTSGPRDVARAIVARLKDLWSTGGESSPASTSLSFRCPAGHVSPECFDVDVVTRTDLYYYGTPETQFYRVRARTARLARATCDNFCPSITKYEGSVDAVTRLILDNEGFVSFGWYRLKNGPGGEKVQVRRPEHHSTWCDVEINCTPDNLSGEPADSSWPGYKLACFDIECKAGGSNEMAFPSSDREEDVVIQISCLIYSLETRRMEKALLFSLGSCDLPAECAAALAGECGGEPTSVLEFDCEFEMLLAFATFVKQFGPEFVTGYNIVNFDLAYLYGKLTDGYGLRLDGYGAVNRGGVFKVWDAGANRFQKKSKAKITGVVSLDMYPVVTEKLRLRSYKLDAVAEAVLGEKKLDMPYKEIPGRFASGAEGRGAIGEYCIRDSALVGKLFFRFLPHLELAAVAKLAGILLPKAIYDGQQIRVYTCILRLAGARGFVLPDNSGRFAASEPAVSSAAPFSPPPVKAVPLSEDGDDDDEDEDGEDTGDAEIDRELDPEEGSGENALVDDGSPAVASAGKKAGGGRQVGYQGATVLEPDTGFHLNPVVVFDFASLYPSIIQANNLCYTTLAPNADRVAALRRGEDYIEVKVLGRALYFVKPHVRESLLAVLLNDWLDMRRAIRAKMARTEDEDAVVLLDKQQAAIKVVCNSVYGFCGAGNGFLPCLDVAASVTTVGRHMLTTIRDYVHEEWGSAARLSALFPEMAPEVDERAYSCRVIYGDTDSMFVKFSGVPAAALVAHGNHMASTVSDTLFRRPIKLECEKTFVKLLLITKKKYVGIIHGGKMIMKGVELVRRNNCRYVNEYSRRLVDLLFGDERVAQAAAEIGSRPAVEWTRRPLPDGFRAFGEVLVDAYERVAKPAGELTVADFVMSAELSRPADAYVNRRIPHLTVYYKLVMRNEQEPAVKDRISYVIVDPTEQTERDAEAVARLRGDPFALPSLQPSLSTPSPFSSSASSSSPQSSRDPPLSSSPAPLVLAPPSPPSPNELSTDAARCWAGPNSSSSSPSGKTTPQRPSSAMAPESASTRPGPSRKRKLLVSDLAEDPKWVTEKKNRLSTEYYFSHLIGSVTVTFKALFGNDTKVTELVLRRFIPETFFEQESEIARLERAGFAALRREPRREGRGEGEGGEREKKMDSGETTAGSSGTTVTAEEENRRTLRRALRSLTAARRLC